MASAQRSQDGWAPAEQHDPQALPVLPQQTPPQEGQLVFHPSWLPAPAQPQPSWPPASPQPQSSWPVTAQQPQAAWPVQRGAPPVQPMDLTPHLMPRTRSVNSVRPKFNGAAAGALFIAVVFPPAGLSIAKSARKECLESGKRGAGLALTAHMVAAAGSGLLVLTILGVCGMAAFGITELGTGVHKIGTFLEWVQKLFS